MSYASSAKHHFRMAKASAPDQYARQLAEGLEYLARAIEEVQEGQQRIGGRLP